MRRWLVGMALVIMMLVTIPGCNATKEKGLLLEESECTDMLEESDGEEFEEETEDTIWVYVCGQVLHPGTYELSSDSRIFEAIEAAGGMTEAAADEALNLAEHLTDGQMIQVLSKEEVMEAKKEKEEALEMDGKVNINTADGLALQSLRGVGASKAQAILTYRETNGPFQSIEDIKLVDGIGDGIYSKIKDEITVG